MKYILMAVYITASLVPVSKIGAAHYKAPTVKQIVIKAARKYGIEPALYLAIVQTESSFRVNAYNHKTADYGLSQVNKKTAGRYKLDTKRLLKDAQYNADAGARILADFKRMYKTKEPKTWMCRYNIGTQKLSGKAAEKCIVYLNKVFKHYNGSQYSAVVAKGE